MPGWADIEQRMRASRELAGPRVDAARAVRALIDDVVNADLTDEQLASISTVIAGLRSGWSGVARRGSWADAWRGAEVAPAPESSTFLFTSPMVGPANPVAPPVRFRVEGDRLVGEAVFTNVYEGPPGHVHGGVTAAAFDELLGSVQSSGDNPGMTGRLTVTYRAPTPLDVPIRFVGWLDRIDGRKIFTRGYSETDGPDGPVRCAEAEGLFVSVDFERMRSAWGGGAGGS